MELESFGDCTRGRNYSIESRCGQLVEMQRLNREELRSSSLKGKREVAMLHAVVYSEGVANMTEISNMIGL
jgi:hypothetical protein